MKKFRPILICFFIAIATQAQNFDFKRSFDEIAIRKVPKNIESFIPERWEDESIIILDHKEHYKFKTVLNVSLRTFIHEYLISHYTILLQDKAAVEKFSRFYFLGPDRFSLRVTKANGKVIDYSKDDFEDNIIPSSSFFHDNFEDFHHPYTFYKYFNHVEKSRVNGYKLALSKLEPGDIIQFTFGRFNRHQADQYSALRFATQHEYPVMNESLLIEQQGGFGYMIANSKAPKLIHIKNGVKNSYTIQKTDVDKYEAEKWSMPYAEIPNYLFAFGTKNPHTIGLKRKQLVSEVKQEDILKKMTSFYRKHSIPSRFKLKSKKSLFADKTSKENIVKGLYYLLRFERYYKNLKNTEFLSEADLSYYEEKEFAASFCKLLNMYGVDAGLVIASDFSYRSVKNNYYLNDFEWFVRVSLDNDKTIDIAPPSHYSSLEMENYNNGASNEAYFITGDDLINNEEATLESTTVNLSDVNDNKLTYHTNVELNTNDMVLSIEQNASVAGNFKKTYIPLVLKHNRNAFKDLEDLKNLTPGIYKKYKKKFAKKLNKDSIQVPEYAFSEYDNLTILPTKKINDFEITSEGRYAENIHLEYRMSYKSESAINRSNDDILFNIGAMIDEQAFISHDPDQRKRDANIYINDKKSYINTITFRIPKGYSIGNIEHLKMNVENSAGSFYSSAEIDGDFLVVSTSKTYKKRKYEKNEWTDIQEFVDAAYHFYRQHIVLHKNSVLTKAE